MRMCGHIESDQFPVAGIAVAERFRFQWDSFQSIHQSTLLIHSIALKLMTFHEALTP